MRTQHHRQQQTATMMMISLNKIAFLFVLIPTFGISTSNNAAAESEFEFEFESTITATNNNYVVETQAIIGGSNNNNYSNGSSSSERILVRRPNSERQLPPIRKLTNEEIEEIIFTRSYTVITSPMDITLVNPPNAQGAVTFQGSYFISSGGVYRTSSVELVPVFQINNLSSFLITTQVLQPKTIAAIDDDFTFGGKCTVTNGKSITKITSHSCFYDLCLGSPTDCVNIYAGTRFDFSPLQQTGFRGFQVNNQNNGVLNPKQECGGGYYGRRVLGGRGDNGGCGERKLSKKTRNKSTGIKGSKSSRKLSKKTRNKSSGIKGSEPSSSLSTAWKLQNQEGSQKNAKSDLSHGRSLRSESSNGRFALPPNFPGFVFGGTGRYQNIKGTFDLITVAQRTAFPTPALIETSQPTASPTLTDEPTDNSNNRARARARDLSQEEEDRELQRKFDQDGDDDGVIVQKIFLSTNQRLPLGPKAI